MKRGRLVGRVGSVLVCACLAALAAAARADVDLQVGNGDKVRGVVGAGESATLRVLVPGGATLSVSVQGKKTKGTKGVPVATVQVLDVTDTDLAAALTKTTRRGAKVKGLVVPETATYRVVVRTEPGGSFQAAVKWGTPKKVNETVRVAAPTNTQVRFTADAGARVDLRVKAARGSDVLPRLASLAGDDFDAVLAAATAGSKQHAAKRIVVPATGEYVLTVGAEGASEGAAAVSIKVKAPRPAKRKLDVTSRQIGLPASDGADVIGRVIDGSGGTILFPAASNAALDGAALVIPQGALPDSTALLVGTAPPIPRDAQPDRGPAGPTVFLGPAGQQFAVPVTVTIPFDLAAFDGDFSLLLVVERDARGRVTVVPPVTYVIDELNGRVSFPASHFTSFRVFGPLRPVGSDVNGDRIPDLVVATRRIDGGAFHVFFGPLTGGRSEADADVVIRAPDDVDFPARWTLGDFDGDGVADIAGSGSTLGQGDSATRVYFGGPGLAGDLDYDAAADVLLTPPASGGSYGFPLKVADLTGDGIDDLVIGTPNGTPAGHVHVVPGGAGFVTGAPPTITFTGVVPGFGNGVDVGDVNGDGFLDVVAGERDPQGPEDHAYVFFGGETGFANTRAENADVTFTSPIANGSLGPGLVVGDLSGDGTDDIVLADAFAPSQAGSGGGQLYVFLGGPALADALVADADGVLGGQKRSGRFGTRPVIADLDADGTDDLVAYAAAGGPDNRGSIYVYFGADDVAPTGAARDTADVVIDSVAQDDDLGSHMWVYDVTGDGVGDLLTSSPMRQIDTLVNAGEVYVFAARTGFTALGPDDTTFRFPGSRANGAFGGTIFNQ